MHCFFFNLETTYSFKIYYENNDKLYVTVAIFFSFLLSGPEFGVYYLLKMISWVCVDSNLCCSMHSAYGIHTQTQECQQMLEDRKAG